MPSTPSRGMLAGCPPRAPCPTDPMTLDFQTLLVVMMTNLFALSAALPALLGWRVSVAARSVQASMVAHALGWAAILVSRVWQDRLMSTLSMACLAASLLLLWHALRAWLGPRPGRWLMPALALAIPLGYGLSFGSYPFRSAWSNFGLALQMLTLCVALAWPSEREGLRWRLLILLCMLVQAGITATRGVLAAFFTEAYPYFRAPHPVNIAGALMNNVTLVLTAVALLVAWRDEAERALRRQALTDALTGLLNRHAFDSRAAAMQATARRHGHPLALLMVDLDHFKQINDRLGHAVGDRALRLTGEVLRAAMRQGDLACRYGGEEFCMLLAHADETAALAFDRRVRSALRERSQAQLGFTLDFSAGLALAVAGSPDIEQLQRQADGALYRAKAAGRGRTLVARDVGAPSSFGPGLPAA